MLLLANYVCNCVVLKCYKPEAARPPCVSVCHHQLQQHTAAGSAVSALASQSIISHSPKPHRLFYYPKLAEMLSEVSCSMACTSQGGWSSRAPSRAWASMYSRANSLSVVAQLRPPRNNFDGLKMEVGAIG